MTAAVVRESGSFTAHRVFVLRLGAEPSPKSISARGVCNFIIWSSVVGVAVETDAGRVLLETGTRLYVVDAGDLGQNLADRAPGWTADPSDARRAEGSLRRLLDGSERPQARLVPGHDEVCRNATRHFRGGHR